MSDQPRVAPARDPPLVDLPGERMPSGPTRLFPLLRIRGSVATSDVAEAGTRIRKATLQWLERRAGKLPPEAWSFGPFILDHGGSVAEVTRAQAAGGELWAARLRYPDESRAGRVWRAELTLARRESQLAFGLKLDLAAREETPLVDISVPRIARFVIGRIGLRAGTSRIALTPSRCSDGRAVAEHLRDPERTLPTVVLSLVHGDAQAWVGHLDPKALARRLAGLAEIVLLPVAASFALSEAIGKAWSCFRGAVRVYRAPFRPESDSFARHPLYLPERIVAFEDDTGTPFAVHLSQLVARESLGPARPETDVPTFARVQELARAARLQQARSAGQTAEQLLEFAEQEIRALRQRIDELERERVAREEESDQLLTEAERERDEALRELRASRARIEALESRLRRAQIDVDADVPSLKKAAELQEWAERHLAGRLVLLPRAIRDAKGALFQDWELVGRALLYLAGPYRTMRIEGGPERLEAHDRALAALGLENSGVGGDLQHHADRFRVDWRNGKRLLDQHVKNGGNTRDPTRCLRIYFFWDEEEQLVVIGSLPSHIRTGAT